MWVYVVGNRLCRYEAVVPTSEWDERARAGEDPTLHEDAAGMQNGLPQLAQAVF